MIDAKQVVFLAAMVLAGAFVSSAQALLVQECQNDNYRTQRADVVVTGTISNIEYTADYQTKVTLKDLSWEKEQWDDGPRPLMYQVTFVLYLPGGPSGPFVEDFPQLTEDAIGEKVRVQVKKNARGQYNLVCAGMGLQYKRDELPPTPNEKKEFTLQLKAGWNLVSVPVGNYQQGLCPGAPCVYNEAGEVECIGGPCYDSMPANLKENTCGWEGAKVFAYDEKNKKYVEQTNKLSEKIYPMGGFVGGKAYWVKVSSACEMTFEGTHELDEQMLSSGEGWSLQKGWDTLGAPAKNTEFSKVSGACQLSSNLWKYNVAARKWERVQVLKPGEGYFIKNERACNLGVPSTEWKKKTCEQTGGMWDDSTPDVSPYCSCGWPGKKWDEDKGCVPAASGNVKIEVREAGLSLPTLEFYATNNGAKPIYFVSVCESPLSFERKVGGGWAALTLEGPDVMRCMAFALAEIKPGETRRVGAWNQVEYVGEAAETAVTEGKMALRKGYRYAPSGIYRVAFAHGFSRDDYFQQKAYQEFRLPYAN